MNGSLHPDIGILFLRRDNKSYSRQILLYRDILRFGLINIDTFFLRGGS